MGMLKVDPNSPQGKNDEQVQQSFKDDADINKIIARGKKTGIFGTGIPGNRKARFGDFTSIDYMTMMNQVADVESQFMTLSPKLRTRFKNDPYQLIRFVEDPDNLEEARRLKLLPEVLPDLSQATPAGVEELKTALKADKEANPFPTKKGAKAPPSDGD